MIIPARLLPIQDWINVRFIVHICSTRESVDQGEETIAGAKEERMKSMGESPGFGRYDDINKTNHSSQTMAREVLEIKRMSSRIVEKCPVH